MAQLQFNCSQPPQNAPQQQQQLQQQQQQLEAHFHHHLEATGELSRLQHQFHAQLIECGWQDAMRDRARELIRQKRGGLANVTFDELVAELIPAGRAMVPAEVKGKAMDHVQAILMGGGNGNGGGNGSGSAAAASGEAASASANGAPMS